MRLRIQINTQRAPCPDGGRHAAFQAQWLFRWNFPKKFLSGVLCINSEIFPPAFLLASLSPSKLSAGSGWLWLGSCLFYQSPCRTSSGCLWLVGTGSRLLSSGFAWSNLVRTALVVLRQVIQTHCSSNLELPVPYSPFRTAALRLCFMNRDSAVFACRMWRHKKPLWDVGLQKYVPHQLA